MVLRKAELNLNKRQRRHAADWLLRLKLCQHRRGQPAEETAWQARVVAQNNPVAMGYFRHVLDIASRSVPDNKHRPGRAP
jgi:hypothetical protein